MDAHVNEQLVARVKRSVATRAAGPEAGKVLCPPLVYVTSFDVLDELLLGLVAAFAIDPTAMKDANFITIGRLFFFIGGQLARPAVFGVGVNRRELKGLVVLRRWRHERRLSETVSIATGADAGRSRRVDDPVAAAVATATESGVESAGFVLVVQRTGQIDHQVLFFQFDKLGRRNQIGAVIVHEDVIIHHAQRIFHRPAGRRLLRRPVKIERRQFHLRRRRYSFGETIETELAERCRIFVNRLGKHFLVKTKWKQKQVGLKTSGVDSSTLARLLFVTETVSRCNI